MSTNLLFCGRERELALIDERWRMASDVANPVPQIVVIDAERGAGKTRLALEWFRRTATALPEGSRYWPDPAQLLGRSLSLNLDPAQCQFDRPIPFLWWGIGAQEDRSEAVAHHSAMIAPHLVAMSMRANMAATGLELSKIWAEVGIDAAANVLQIDTIMSVGSALFETARLLGGSHTKFDPRAAHLAEELRAGSRIDALLSDLEKVMNPRSRIGYAAVPAAILIDDAQFAIGDPTLTRFAERLFSDAMRQRWPLMILITHWRRELATDLMRSERSMSGILHHARHGAPDEPGPAAGTLGGYLNDGNYVRIALPQIPDLSLALSASFPGITREQASALVERVGGNPRFLEQIIAYLSANPRLFDDFDQAAALSGAGLAEALDKSVAIHDVVMARLLDEQVPPEVREALSLASVQGMRVVSDIVDAAGEALLGRSLRDALRAGDNPLAMFAFEGDGEVGAFAERLFMQVAEELRRNTKGIHDEAVVKAALRQILSERLTTADVIDRLDRNTLEASAGVALKLCSDPVDPEQRALILSASCIQQYFAGEPETEREALDRFMAALAPAGTIEKAEAERLVAALPQYGLLAHVGVALFLERDADALAIADPCLAVSRNGAPPAVLAEWLEVRGTIAAAMGQGPKGASCFDEALRLRRGDFASMPDAKTARGLAKALTHQGRLCLQAAMPGSATRYAQEAVTLYRDLRDKEIVADTEVNRGLGAALNGLWDIARQAGDRETGFAALVECLEVTRALAAQGDDQDKRNLSAVLNSLADLLASANLTDPALAMMDESVEIAGELASRLLGVQPQHDLGSSFTIRARVYRARGDHDARISDLEHAVAIMRGLFERLRTLAAAQDQVAARRNLAQALHESGRAEAANEIAREAALDEAMPPISRARAEFELAAFAFGKGREDEGEAALARGLGLARAAVAAHRFGGTTEDRMTLGYIQVTMAQRCAAKNDHGAALSHAEQVIFVLMPLAEGHESRQRVDAVNEAMHIALTITPMLSSADHAKRIFHNAMLHAIHLAQGGFADETVTLLQIVGAKAEACQLGDVVAESRQLMNDLFGPPQT